MKTTMASRFCCSRCPDKRCESAAAKRRHEIPGLIDGERITWRVTSAGGREHFLGVRQPGAAAAHLRSPVREAAASHDRSARGAALQRVKSALRGVGGLVKAPAMPSSTGLTAQFQTPLPNGEETARGVWARQLTLENPGR